MKDRKTQILESQQSDNVKQLLPMSQILPRREAVRLIGIGAFAGLGWLAGGSRLARGDEQSPRSTKRVPVKRTPPDSRGKGKDSSSPSPAKHPLDAALEKLYSCRETMKGVKDYTCTFARREEIRGNLEGYEYIYMKCRNQPFSVYLYWLKPYAGREVIYAEGKYNGQLIVHETGLKDAVAGTLELDPRGKRAMKNSRHPITEAGIAKLIDQFIEGAEHERRYGEVDVRFFKNAKVEGRICSWFEVKHPYPRREFAYHVLRVYIDDALNLPVRMEAYGWPRRQGEKPRLVEEYTFMKLKLNVGLTDLAFDPRNPRYAF